MTQLELLKQENAALKQERAGVATLLRNLKTQVGTFYGEQIDEHLAVIEGRKHDARAWDMADKNGEQ